MQSGLRLFTPCLMGWIPPTKALRSFGASLKAAPRLRFFMGWVWGNFCSLSAIPLYHSTIGSVKDIFWTIGDRRPMGSFTLSVGYADTSPKGGGTFSWLPLWGSWQPVRADGEGKIGHKP